MHEAPIQGKRMVIRKKQTRTVVKKTSAKKKPETANFPIVGIGASAGGLEAFSAFFNSMPRSLSENKPRRVAKFLKAI